MQGIGREDGAEKGNRKKQEENKDIWSWKLRAEMEGVVTVLVMEDGK